MVLVWKDENIEKGIFRPQTDKKIKDIMNMLLPRKLIFLERGKALFRNETPILSTSHGFLNTYVICNLEGKP